MPYSIILWSLTCYLFFSAPSRQPCFSALTSAFRRLCLPDSRHKIGTKSCPANLLLPDHFFASTPPFSLSPLPYYPFLYLSDTPIMVLPPAHLLAALLAIFFLVVFATGSPIYPNSFSALGVPSSTFGNLYTDPLSLESRGYHDVGIC